MAHRSGRRTARTSRRAVPEVAAAPQGYLAPSGYPPAGYHGYPGYPGYPGYSGYPGYPGYPGYQAQVPAARAPARSGGQHSVAMTVIALGGALGDADWRNPFLAYGFAFALAPLTALLL